MPITSRFIPSPITKSYYAFGFMYPNLWNERLNEIISDLITGGFVNYHLEKMTKSKWNLMQAQFETENVVLNLHHLGFGFQICLIFAYLAFLTFLFEIVWVWMKSCWKSYNHECQKRKKHKIIMVLSAKNTHRLHLNKDKKFDKSAQMTQHPKIADDEYSSDDSNSSKHSILRRAFGKKVKHTEKNGA